MADDNTDEFAGFEPVSAAPAAPADEFAGFAPADTSAAAPAAPFPPREQFRRDVGRYPENSVELENYQATPQLFTHNAAGQQLPTPRQALSRVAGVGEGALTTAEQFTTTPVAGFLAHVGTLLATGDPDAAKAVRDSVMDTVTYQPRTAAGQSIAQAPGEVIHNTIGAAWRAAKGPEAKAAVEKAARAQFGDTATDAALSGLEMGNEAFNAIPGTLSLAKAGGRGGSISRLVEPFRGGDIPPGTQFDHAGNAIPPKSPAPGGVQEPAAAPPSIDEVLGSKTPAQEPQAAPAPAAAQPQAKVAPAAAEAPAAPASAKEAGTPAAPTEPSAQELENHRALAAVGFDGPVRESAITGDKMTAATDSQVAKADTPKGREAAAIFDNEADTLHRYSDRLVDQAGGTRDITDSVANDTRGQTFAAPAQAGYDDLNARMKALYKAADDRSATLGPTPLPSLSDLMQNKRSMFTVRGNDGVAILKGVQQWVKENGLEGPNHTINPMTPFQAEELRKVIGDGYSPRTGKLTGMLQDAIDDDVSKHAGEDLYGASRALRRERDLDYDKPDAVSKLLEPKPGDKRGWAFGDIGKKFTTLPTEELAKYTKILDKQRANPALKPAAEAALHELRGQFAQMVQEAGKPSAAGVGKQAVWGADAVSKVLRANRARMKLVFGDHEMAQFDALDKAGKILKVDRNFKGSVVEGHNIAMRGALFAAEHVPTLVGAVLGHGMGAVAGEMVGKRITTKLENAAAPSVATRQPLGAKLPGQRGAVGELSVREKASPFVHSTDDMGDHVVQTRDYEPGETPNSPPKRGGRIVAEDKGDALQIRRSDVAASQQRGGLGTGLVRELADRALAEGKQLHSDFSLSKGATGTYGRLAGEGYDVRVNPHVTIPHTLEDGTPTHTLMTEDNQSPVFEIHSAPPARKLGESPAFASQRGSIDLWNSTQWQNGDRVSELGRNGRNGTITDRYPFMGRVKVKWDDGSVGEEPVHMLNPFERKDYGAKPAGEPRPTFGPAPGEQPLGARIGGGKQRGAVGDLNKRAAKDETPLEGAPQGDRPNGRARAAGAAYIKANNLGTAPISDYRFVTPELGKAVADAYEGMKHDPTNPKVKAAYDAFKAETLEQYKQAAKAGMRFTLDPNYPYKVPREVMDDVRDNHHMSIFPTEGHFGSGESAFSDHPLLERFPLKIGGKDATYNDAFRAVHDYFGHVAEGNGFRANGEYNAWRSHRQMYSDAARPAMDAETLGQNSWVNFGPHGEFNRGAKIGWEPGAGGGASQLDTKYADQKAGIMKLPKAVMQSLEEGVGADEHHVTGLLTPAERDQLRANTTERLIDRFKSLPDSAEYAAAALAGKAKRGWYRASAEAILNHFGLEDGGRFTALLAAMSPQTSVQMNFSNALRTFLAWDQKGRPTDPAAIRQIMEENSAKNPKSKSDSNVLDAWVNNSVRALTEADPLSVKLSGPKVHSFYNNLLGHVNEVTNDAWMSTFAKIDPTAKGTSLSGGLNNSGPGKTPMYMAMSARVREAATMLTRLTGETWTPAEVQETVWSWAKTAFEHAEEQGDQTIPDLVKHGKITDDLIRSTPDFHQLFATPEHAGLIGRSRFARNVEGIPAAQGAGAQPVANAEKTAAAERALRPHLDKAAQRLEEVRQDRSNAGAEEAPF